MVAIKSSIDPIPNTINKRPRVPKIFIYEALNSTKKEWKYFFIMMLTFILMLVIIDDWSKKHNFKQNAVGADNSDGFEIIFALYLT